jgi:predicted  nucleic acid-binding Zn-ribbon protein
MSRPFKLYRLQQLDSHIDWLESRLDEVKAALQDTKLLRLAEQRMGKAENGLGEARKALRSAEDSVRGQRLKIEQSEATLYGGKVQNPKELQDIQNEVASLKRYLEVLEDRQLEAMLVEEDAASRLQLAGQELDKVQQATARQHGELTREQDSLLTDLANHRQERMATAGSVESEDLALYDQLRAQRRGIAVAKVTDRACSACGSTLSTSLLHAARSPNQITRCDTCGRILYTG